MAGPYERISMIYDADGGLRGELAHAWSKLRGGHCYLCDLTHGRLRERPAFAQLRCSLGVPVDVLHRNEQHGALAEFTQGRLPCVVGHRPNGFDLLVDPAALDACAGDVDRFAELLAAAPGTDQGAGVIGPHQPGSASPVR